MSCQSLQRTFEPQTQDHHGPLHRSVRFSSESRSSTRREDKCHEVEGKKETSAVVSMSQSHCSMSQSAPCSSTALTFDLQESTLLPAAACRFPKLEECAHFHYERVCLGGLDISTTEVPCDEMCTDWTPSEGWICLKVRSHVNGTSNPSSGDECTSKQLSASWTEASDVREWTLCRNREHFLQLDDMLHRCIYDRKVSGLPNLRLETARRASQGLDYSSLISDYLHHLSIIADDTINCGPVLNWLQMDNKGHKLLVASEDWHSINTPAVAAAYSVRKYVSQAHDEISFDVGDMISIIDMPGPNESLWWRGKRGFRVGFFPHHCVAVIGDKVPRHMTQPPPIVGSVAVAPIKPVLRKHGKLISLFRSFILSRPSRRSLKQQGILRERVFGCDLGEHLLNCGHDVPLVLVECSRAIESLGCVDGIYRLSGGSGLTQRLRAEFDAGRAPDLAAPAYRADPHAAASLLKMYFRELPNPLCTYQLYESFVNAVQQPDEASKLKAVRDTVVKLPPPHYRTLAYLMRHLRRVSLHGGRTGMTARNMAIVWAPNLLRAPRPQHALQGVAVQAVVTEFLICFAEELFAQEQGEESGPSSLDNEEHKYESIIELRGTDSCRRPKSLPLHPPTKLLSLEEARRRGGASGNAEYHSASASASAGASAGNYGSGLPIDINTQLRPQTDHKPKYIEVGSGPDNLPQYHTVLDLPAHGKRGLKRSPSGWLGLFSRSKHQRHRAHTRPAPAPPHVHTDKQDIQPDTPILPLRPVKSCESLTSDTDTVPPLAERTVQPLKHHTRSSSCDSYFEPWQAELADMRLRLSPQERDNHMFSEEDDTALQNMHLQQDESLCSTPVESVLCSAEPSPRKNLTIDIDAANDLAERQRFSLEQQMAVMSYIDVESPRHTKPKEKRHTNASHTLAKRMCIDRDSPISSVADFQTSIGNVKLRERNSPRKARNSTRFSAMHHAGSSNDNISNISRLSWHGRDGHSTLIKIDWPAENSSISNLTSSTINTPITPLTPNYEALESDSDVTENKHTIKIKNCDSCKDETCLKCELKATDYENVRFKDYKNFKDPQTNISYQNLNRLSAVSSSTDSERKEGKVATHSHDSSSSSNPSKNDDYETFNFRPDYVDLQSSPSKSSPGSPTKSPLKSTISITFRSPSKARDYDDETDRQTPTNDRESVYEDLVLEKDLTIVEDATVPNVDASLPTPATQPDFNQDLIILETPTRNDSDPDVYSQVKFFKKSIEEVNAMILETPVKDTQERHYENVSFKDYENINVGALKIADGVDNGEEKRVKDNGNSIKTNLNVRELAVRFESPTEQKGPFIFEKFKAEIKYPSIDRKESVNKKGETENKPPISPKGNGKLSRSSSNARSLDENAFVKEFGGEKQNGDRRKSLEVKDIKTKKFLPDLNLNLTEESKEIKHESITPTTENKISLIQRFEVKKPVVKDIISFDTEKKLSRERIEKYKEERRNFLREKYSSQSFRSNPEQLTRIKIKKDDAKSDVTSPKFERRNTVDLGQRMRFSLAKSANDLDSLQNSSPNDDVQSDNVPDVHRSYERKEKMSPSYNIRDMAALFEQKSQSNSG